MKKPRRKTITKSIVSLMLILCLMSGVVVTSVVPASAAGITSFLFGEIKAWGICYAKKGLIKGIDAAGSAAGMDSDFTDYIDKLILGPSASTANKTIELCNEILNEVKVIEEDISQVQNSVNDIITTINTKTLKENYLMVYSKYVTEYSTKLEIIKKMTEEEIAYAEAVKKGKDYVVYVKEGKDPLVNQQVIDTELKELNWLTVDNKVNYNQIRDEKNKINGYLCNIINGITGFNGNNTSTVANEDRTSQADVTGDFYKAVMKVVNDSNKFGTETQAYEFIGDCVNCALEPIATLLYYSKMMMEFLVSCEINDVNIADSDKKDSGNAYTSIVSQNKLYKKIYNKTTNAVNEMLEDFTPTMNKLMREYDVEQTTKMNYKSSDEITLYKASYWKGEKCQKSSATVTKPEIGSYVFIPNGSDKTYMLLDTSKIKVKDLFSKRTTKISGDKVTSYSPNQNFYNLTSTKNGYYKLPNEHKTAYKAYSDLVTNKTLSSVGINSFIKNNITNEPINTDFYNYMFINDVDWDIVTRNWENCADNDIYGINTNAKIYKDNKDFVKELDIKKNNLCSNNKNPMIVLEGKRASEMSFKMSYSSNDNIPISIYNNYEEKYTKNSEGDYEISYSVKDEIKNNSTLHPTDMMYIKVKPDENRDFSLDLYNSSGKKLYQIATQNDTIGSMQTSDGYYVFSLPMTYQDCSIRISYN